MEGGKESGSSFTSDIFGAKGSAPSAGIFDSIFAPPPPRVSGGVSIFHLSETEKKNDSASRQPTGNAKSSTTVSGGENQKWSRGNKDEKISSSYEDYYEQLHDEGKVEPCHYSSSIYYGGQDLYSQPKLNAGLTTFCKDVGEDDSGSASRGNWWQGSLYY